MVTSDPETCAHCEGTFDLTALPVCRDRVCPDCYEEHLHWCLHCLWRAQYEEWIDLVYDRRRDEN